MSRPDIIETAAKYYTAKLAQHGATPAGVDWNSERSQSLRFDQFMPLISDGDASLCDYGCGYGAFLDYARGRGHRGSYVGFDASDAMACEARSRHTEDRLARFTSVRSEVPVSDFTVASGIFNVRQATPVDEWRDYLDDVIGDLAALSRRGFAFNVLSSYSDPEKRRPDLYYADPLELFERCLRRWPRRVAIGHDYDLYEFTVTVKL
ncbi:MAG TPA: class I SAM-dependent methyltransferase [Vicinamibacterales bacterium]|nr:class I SAM-dependent methyltransferase [Vicinamibacterales bacterium]